MLNKIKKVKGFTLIELIIVIAIIAILAAIAVPAFGQIRQKANVSTDVANARTIYSTVASLVADETIILPSTDSAVYTLKSVGAGNPPVDLTSTTGTEYLPGMSAPKAYQNSQFVVQIDKDGNIAIGLAKDTTTDETTVTTMDPQIYPNPTEGSYYAK